MRRDSFAAGFWCALVVVALILVARREEEPRREVIPPAPAAIVPARFVREAPPAPEPPRLLVEQEAVYSGNASTHRFHKRSCRYFSCTNCTAHFATPDEAIAAGFRPGGCCNP
jgi:hypothetical protein